MIGALAIMAWLSFVNAAAAAEYGYSILEHRGHSDIEDAGRGFEGRINFGGSGERYSGDRWTLAVGHVNSRLPDTDNWIDTPNGCCAYIEKIDDYQFINFTHRWYTRQGRFRRAPRLRFFVGTGVSWRNAETCVSVRPGDPEQCWDGTPSVSNRWAFHQSAGFKWREILEVAWEHDSTGRLSAINHGDDVIRFTLFAMFLGKNARLSRSD